MLMYLEESNSPHAGIFDKQPMTLPPHPIRADTALPMIQEATLVADILEEAVSIRDQVLHEAGESRNTGTLEGKSHYLGARQKKKLEKKLADLREKIVDLEQQLEREKTKNAGLRKEKRQLDERLVSLREDYENDLKAALEDELARKIHAWMLGAEKLEALADAVTGSETKYENLTDRAREYLSLLKTADRQSRNVLKLVARLKELEDLHTALSAVAMNTIGTLPRIDDLLASVAKQRSLIRARLGQDVHAEPIEERLLGRIADAEGLDQLRAIGKILDDLRREHLLGDDALDGLEQQLNRRRDACYDQQKVPRPTAKDSLREFAEHCLIVDGYNVIKVLDHLFGDALDPDGKPGKRARDRLQQMLVTITRETAVTATLFFDSEQPDEEVIDERVRVVFSGGGTANVRNRADNAIVRYLEGMAPERRKQTIVVTDDHALQLRANKTGASSLRLSGFAPVLADAWQRLH